MWVLVIGPARTLEQPEGAASLLASLGCRVVTADLWDDLGSLVDEGPPLAVFVEALSEVGAARSAMHRCQSIDRLRDVPFLVGVSVSALSGIKPEDAFDDIVLHPYVGPELYLRVRRAEWKKSDFHSSDVLKMGRLHIDLAAHETKVDGRPVELTQQEFALLSFLCQRRGRVFSRDQLLEQVWGVDYYGGSRTVDIHVRRLRQKLGGAVAELETVRGVGYKMRSPA